MNKGEPAQDLSDDREGERELQLAILVLGLADQLVEVSTAHVLHREVRDPVDHRLVEDLHDVRMLDPRHHLLLHVEHLDVIRSLRIRAETLEDHQLFETFGAERATERDLAHTTAIDDPEDLIAIGGGVHGGVRCEHRVRVLS